MNVTIKNKATQRTHKNATLLEIDELGNIIVQYFDARKSIVQHNADEIKVMHTFKTTCTRLDAYGDEKEIKTTRTATLRIDGFANPVFSYTESGYIHQLRPDASGRFHFPRRSPRYTA